jgi:hypothetical protein
MNPAVPGPDGFFSEVFTIAQMSVLILGTFAGPLGKTIAFCGFATRRLGHSALNQVTIITDRLCTSEYLAGFRIVPNFGGQILTH